MEERLYAYQDPYWDVSVVGGTTGAVQERYAYSVFGDPLFFTGHFEIISVSALGWNHLLNGYMLSVVADVYYARNRLYHSMLGVWCQRDRLGYVDGLSLYAAFFVLAEAVDPDGTQVDLPKFKLPKIPQIPWPKMPGIKPGVSCEDICNSAKMNPDWKADGGGVICYKEQKCACVFGFPQLGIKQGDCPSLDESIRKHERKHFGDVDCHKDCPLDRPPFKDPEKVIKSECRLRKISLKDLEKIIKSGSDGPVCTARIGVIRANMNAWVKVNCNNNSSW